MYLCVLLPLAFRNKDLENVYKPTKKSCTLLFLAASALLLNELNPPSPSLELLTIYNLDCNNYKQQIKTIKKIRLHLAYIVCVVLLILIRTLNESS